MKAAKSFAAMVRRQERRGMAIVGSAVIVTSKALPGQAFRFRS
jgi:hypothetical protein